MSHYDSLVVTLTRFADQAKTQPLTLGEALDSLDETAYGLIALILALPYMQPIPLGPLTVLGGLTFAALGWQLWRGHETPSLPRKLRGIALNEKIWGALVKVCLTVVGFCRKFTRPRYTSLISGRLGQKIGAFILIAAGLLIAIPFGVLPFNNLIPDLAVVFYCIGEFEDDGLMVIIAFAWLAITVIYFGLFFFGLWYFGEAAVRHWLP